MDEVHCRDVGQKLRAEHDDPRCIAAHTGERRISLLEHLLTISALHL